MLSLQFSSFAHSCPTLCSPMDCSTPGLAVLHQLLELGQTYVHRVGDSIQPSHPLSSSLLLPSMLPSNRVFSNESVLHISWPKYWGFTFSICPSNEYSGLDYMDRIINLDDGSQNKTHQIFSFKQKNMLYFYC